MESGHRRRDEWTVSRDRWRVDTVGGTSGLCLGTWHNGVKFECYVIPLPLSLVTFLMMNLTVSLVTFLMMNLTVSLVTFLIMYISTLPCNFSKNEHVCQIETNQQRNERRECVSERL